MSGTLSKQDLAHFAGALHRILGRSDDAGDRIEDEYLDRGVGGLDVQGDEGTDRAFEEVDLDALDVEEDTARAALDALRRIAAGTYGTCTECGGAIPRGRLEAVPYAALCIDCQEAAEEEEEPPEEQET